MHKNKRFLGIDPGTRRVGFGIVENSTGGIRFVDAGLLNVQHEEGPAALQAIRTELIALCAQHRPVALGIEKLYFARNRKTALRVAEARGVALAAAQDSRLQIFEFNPNEVKLGIAGYGGADKRSVAKMVRLTLREPDLQVIDDATDALALAILVASRSKNRAEI